jgi:hypothetical protein
MSSKRNNCPQISILLLVIGFLFLSTFSSAQIVEDENGPGISYEYPEDNMLFIKGDGDSPFFDRNWSVLTGFPQGSVSFSRTSSTLNPNILNVQSSPIDEPFRFEGNISVILYASLEGSGSNSCETSDFLPSPVGSETQFEVSLLMGGISVISNQYTQSISMSEGYTSPHEFSVRVSQVNVSLNKGDTVDLSINVRHECVESGALLWGNYDVTSGIVFEGKILDIKVEALIDANRMIRVEMTPISPWGIEDFPHQIFEIVGPTEWSSMYHGKWDNEDLRQYHFEIPQGIRVGDDNRTTYTWSTDKPLEPGKYMIDMCIDLSDQDPVNNCNIIIILRFSVPEDKKSLVNGMWAAIIIPVGILGWIFVSLKEAMLPLPAYGVIILLAFASLGPAAGLPDIDSEPFRDNGAVPPFMLISHNPDTNSMTLSDLMENSQVVVIGMFQHGSPNALLQYDDFSKSLKNSEIDISYVQIATGEGLEASYLDSYSQKINGSWPLLIDEYDSRMGLSLPNKASDAVLVVDSAGFITKWKPGSMSSSEIEEASIKASFGSGNNPIQIILLVFSTTFLPLIVLAMPREREFKFPEEPLLPGAGSLLILYSSAVGFAYWALPVALFSTMGLGFLWIWIEFFLACLLTYHGISILKSGKIIEIEYLSNLAYKKLPDSYRSWKSKESFSEDAYLGLWLAWLLWLQSPDMISQGVGGIARSGLFGPMISLLFLTLFIFCAGISVIMLRNLALIFGPISRIFGEMSIGLRPRAWGIVSTIFGLWILFSIALGPLS